MKIFQPENKYPLYIQWKRFKWSLDINNYNSYFWFSCNNSNDWIKSMQEFFHVKEVSKFNLENYKIIQWSIKIFASSQNSLPQI